MYKSYSMELAGRTLTVDIGRVCAQANGAALMHYGETTVLSSCTASEKPRDGVDFFPLSVEYEEKMYAVGKFPGGFKKREARPADSAILTDRVIDRPMRPLFPKDYRNDVLLDNLVLSVDQDCSPELLAMLGSSLAACISDVPFDGPCASTQVGMINGEFIMNPGNAEKTASDLLLTVASTRDKVIMIEAGANEISDEKMIEAIYLAHGLNQQIIGFFDSIIAECGKKKHEYVSCSIPETLFERIREIVPEKEMEKAVFADDKKERDENLSVLSQKLEEAFSEDEEALSLLPEALQGDAHAGLRKAQHIRDIDRPHISMIDGEHQDALQIIFLRLMCFVCFHFPSSFSLRCPFPRFSLFSPPPHPFLSASTKLRAARRIHVHNKYRGGRSCPLRGLKIVYYFFGEMQLNH